MKAFGIIALLISLVIVAVLAGKQRKAAVKTTTLAPSGKEVEMAKLPDEVKNELDSLSKQSEKRIEEEP
jgi:hypothetical protein